jgi:3-oxoacyl-(acyl-carrier-protein) synthase
MALTRLAMRIAGFGAVTPAGWGADALVAAVTAGQPLPHQQLTRAEGARQMHVRRVPKPAAPLPFLREARLRRTSPVAQFAVAAALEALGPERAAAVRARTLRLGVISVVMNGCVNYSARFYREVLDNPGTASPLVFPETVFNAPVSHLCAFLGSHEISYTFVADSAQFLAALDLAALWLDNQEIDACLVVGTEEFDWLSAEGAALLDRHLITAEGAAALLLEKSSAPGISVATPVSFSSRVSRAEAARRVRREFADASAARAVLFDGCCGSRRTDAAETAAWADWTGPRVSVKSILGEGLGAGTGWQCVAAAAWLAAGHGRHALVNAVGSNQQAIAALFHPCPPEPS